jgi:hypothetical protein
MRTVIATFVAPLVVVSGIVLPMLFSPRKEFDGLGSVIFMVFFQYLFTLVLTIGVVVPLGYLWRRWDFMRGWVAALIGFSIGCGAAGAFSFTYAQIPIFSSQRIPPVAYAKLFSVLGVIGAVAGIVFWLIAKLEMRPNKSLERA